MSSQTHYTFSLKKCELRFLYIIKRVLIENIHKRKAELAKTKAATELAELKKTRARNFRERKAARLEERSRLAREGVVGE